MPRKTLSSSASSSLDTTAHFRHGRASWLINPLPRNRNRRRDPEARRIVSHAPLPDGQPSSETSLQIAFDAIACGRPAQAARLAWLYDHSVLEQRRILVNLHMEFEHDRNVVNSEIERVQAEQERLLERAEAARRPFVEQAWALDETLYDAHQRAAEACARAGRAYDAQYPGPETLLHIEARDITGLSAEHQIPDPRSDTADLLPARAMWACTALFSALLGIAFGVLCRAFSPSQLSEEPWRVLPWAILGAGPAICNRFLVFLSCRELGQRSYLNLTFGRRVGITLLALAAVAVVVALDMLLSAEGLLKSNRLDELIARLGDAQYSTSTPIVITYAIGLVIALGYFGVAGWQGFLKGRMAACEARLLASREAQARLEREAHLIRPEVREALTAIGAVANLQRRISELHRRADDAARPYLEQVARLEQRRQALPSGLTVAQMDLLEDAHHNFRGVTGAFQTSLDREIERLEQGCSLIQRWTRMLRRCHARIARERL